MLRLLAVAVVVLGILPASVAAPVWNAVCGHAATAVAPMAPEKVVAVRGDAATVVSSRATQKVPLPEPIGGVLREVDPEPKPTAAVGRGQIVPRAPPRSPDPLLRPAAHGPPAFV